MGCLVLEAGDGHEGFRVLQSDASIDLLITDVGLPGMNGRQLADAGRQLRPALPVLMVTGYANRAFDDTPLPAGMEVLAKPFKLDALAVKIGVMLKSPGGRS